MAPLWEAACERTELVVSVEVPALEVHEMMSFDLRPCQNTKNGHLLDRIRELVQEMASDLKEHFVIADSSGSRDKHARIKTNSLKRLEEWRERLKHAENQLRRADTAKQQMNLMREKYLKELTALREQLHKKELVEKQGQVFEADDVCLFDPSEFVFDDGSDAVSILRQKAEILNFRFKERVAVYAKRVDEAHAQVAAKTLMLERKDLLLERVMKKFKLSDAEAKRLEAGLQPETVAAKQQEAPPPSPGSRAAPPAELDLQKMGSQDELPEAPKAPRRIGAAFRKMLIFTKGFSKPASKCDTCGAAMTADDASCSRCGAAGEGARGQAAADRCRCGNAFVPEAEVCRNCGMARTDPRQLPTRAADPAEASSAADSQRASAAASLWRQSVTKAVEPAAPPSPAEAQRGAAATSAFWGMLSPRSRQRGQPLQAEAAPGRADASTQCEARVMDAMVQCALLAGSAAPDLAGAEAADGAIEFTYAWAHALEKDLAEHLEEVRRCAGIPEDVWREGLSVCEASGAKVDDPYGALRESAFPVTVTFAARHSSLQPPHADAGRPQSRGSTQFRGTSKHHQMSAFAAHPLTAGELPGMIIVSARSEDGTASDMCMKHRVPGSGDAMAPCASENSSRFGPWHGAPPSARRKSVPHAVTRGRAGAVGKGGDAEGDLASIAIVPTRSTANSSESTVASAASEPRARREAKGLTATRRHA